MSNNGAGLELELEGTVNIALDFQLITIRKYLTGMMMEVQRDIHGCGYTEISKTDLASVKKINQLRERLQNDEDAKQRQYAMRLTCKFLKLYRLLEAGLTECYETLVAYATELRRQAAGSDKNAGALAEEIISDTGFKRVEKIAIAGIGHGGYNHPKIKALIGQCLNLQLLKRQGIIFVGNKLLGQTLADKLNKCGLRAATLMGARAGNQTAHNYASQRFLSGQADFLICTSVLESQNYPELQAGGIICYTLPQTAASKQARQDHAAKDELTFISNLVVSSSPDGSFWLLKRQIRQQASEAAIAETKRAVQLNLTL